MKRSKPNASPAHFSKDVLALNPDLSGVPTGGRAASRSLTVTSQSVLGVPVAKKGKKRREMNATEKEFSLFLEARWSTGEIRRWDYEGITLRWPDGMRYTSDFNVYLSTTERITMIEVKGSYAWAKDIVKYRAAMDRWKCFDWEFWMKTSTGWEMTR